MLANVHAVLNGLLWGLVIIVLAMLFSTCPESRPKAEEPAMGGFALYCAASQVARSIQTMPLTRSQARHQAYVLEAIYYLRPGLDYAPQLSHAIAGPFAAKGLNLDLAVALCWAESSFALRACNPVTHCAGLYQIHPCHGVTDVYDVDVNCRWGAGILAACIEQAGSARGGLRRYGTNVDRVLALQRILKKEGHGAQNQDES